MTAELPVPRIPRFILLWRKEDLLPAWGHVSASHRQLLVSLIPVPLPCGLLLPFDCCTGAEFTRRTSVYTVHAFCDTCPPGFVAGVKLGDVKAKRADSSASHGSVNCR